MAARTKNSGASTKAKRSSSRKSKDSKKLLAKSSVGGVNVNSNRQYLDRDKPALEGHFVEVVSGKYQGKYGVYDQTLSTDADGFPKEVLVVTRDNDSARLTVKYDDLEASRAGRR